MQITIGESEFKEAIGCWLNTQGFNPDKFYIAVNVIAGRKFGTTAEITMTPKTNDPEVVEKPTGHTTIPAFSIGD